ncbi:pyrimidine reductase [Microtetraspora sp. NBRC 13810]|uniref:dihydrofolate reductase family protein n=1 Tax=Microtetraspora sp. NBRC 13810 TaxID=3030990 RepID=UPI0025541BB9|nr:dihydrofolate reductase family protein [Microtetraspora sp. NBRC 13810]GLW08990.1 pyrimidine reductase [Microtetraspora sp. NBRC 13810]
MRKLVVSEFVSLDGVMQSPGSEAGFRHSGWVLERFAAEHDAHKYEELTETSALLLGRVTYEGFAAAWPSVKGEFADRMNALPKYVVSSTLHEPLAWNASLLKGDVAGEVEALKDEDGEGHVFVHGSRSLAQELMRRGLVDEVRLMVFPVILGSGARLFPGSPDKTSLTLAASRVFDSGVVALTYART